MASIPSEISVISLSYFFLSDTLSSSFLTNHQLFSSVVLASATSGSLFMKLVSTLSSSSL